MVLMAQSSSVGILHPHVGKYYIILLVATLLFSDQGQHSKG